MKIIKLRPIKKSVYRPIKSIKIEGSKSYTNRALLLSAIAPHPVTIINPLKCDDTDAMIDCLRCLGIAIDVGPNFIKVNGSVKDIKNKTYKLNARLSGTTIRFILAFLTIVPGIKILEGESGLNKRPIRNLVLALRKMGAKIEYLEKEGYPPLKIKSSRLKSGNITINGGISSQYISALLMILPCAPKGSIKISGEQISKPYIDMTIDIMKTFGVEIKNNEYKSYELISRGIYRAKKYLVEGDFSSAGYFFALAALAKLKITVYNLNPKSVQPDKKILSVLESMGNIVHYHKNGITLEGRGVRPVSVDMIDFPDQAQTFAVLAAFAKGRTVLSGIQSLRVKETDRIHAIMSELAKMGIRTKLKNYTLSIYGGAPKGARIKTYKDHRMAMSFAVAGAKLKGMEIENPDVVAKTLPIFWTLLFSFSVGMDIKGDKNLILIGMRDSGKSTILKLLAKRLQMAYIDVDNLIVSEAGMSIGEIVQRNGWKYFRDRESEVIKKVSSLTDTLIATGGGSIVRTKNANYLKKNGAFIFLNAGADTLVKRNNKLSLKPRLTDRKTINEEIQILLEERISLYNELADITVYVDNKKPETVVNEIIEKLGMKNNTLKININSK